MSLNTAQSYLIDKTSSLVDGYSETLPSEGVAIVYRCVGGSTNKTLVKGRQYTTYSFNVLVRGEKSSVDIQNLCQSIVELLDLDQTGIEQCNVTSEPYYAFKDDNGNLHYTFNVDVIIS